MAANDVPLNISEEYYQISEAILQSFPKYRPPIDLFAFNTKVAQLVPFSRKGDRLSNEKIDALYKLCEQGDVFVSRSDHPVYSKYIVKQLDLVLVDDNLKESEVLDICVEALNIKLTEFFEQPVKPVFEKVYADIKVVTEYLWSDRHRLKSFLRRTFRGDYSLIHHSVNSMILGLWLLDAVVGKDVTRKMFDDFATGLLLHDIGMSKIPAFILNKTSALTPDEKSKIPPHVLTGAQIMKKLDLSSDVIEQTVLEHHERLDGSGYPQHLQKISLIGRISAVADAFSAMLQKRPYAEAMAPMAAANELSSEKNKFDFTFCGKLVAIAVQNGFDAAKK